MDNEGRITPQSVAETAALVVNAANSTPRDDERTIERTFDVLPTHIPGFSLLVEHGENAADLTRMDTSRLQKLGGPFVTRAEALKRLAELQTKPPEKGFKSPHDEIRDVAVDHPGVRGARDTSAGWEIQINPQTRDIFDADLVEASGEAAAKHVHREVAITIFVNPDVDDVKAQITSAHRRLRRSGYSEERIKDMLRVSESVRIDEEALLEAMESGEINLLPGAHQVQTTKWNVVPKVITTDAERALVEQAVIDASETPGQSAN